MLKSSSLLAVCSVAATAISLLSAPAAVLADTTFTVTPTNLQGWHTADIRNTGSAAITGDAPRSGNGSLEFNLFGGADKASFQLGGVNPFQSYGRLADLTTLGYDFRHSGSSTTEDFQMPSLRLLVFNPSTFQSGILIYEPVYNGRPTTADTWIDSGNIVANNGNFWLRANSTSFYTPSGNGTALSTWKSGTTFTDSGRTSPALNGSTYIYGFELGVGSGVNGTFESFADNFRFGFGTGNVQTYNFETANVTAVPEPGSVAVTATMLSGIAGLIVKSRRRKSA